MLAHICRAAGYRAARAAGKNYNQVIFVFGHTLLLFLLDPYPGQKMHLFLSSYSQFQVQISHQVRSLGKMFFALNTFTQPEYL